MKNEIRSNGKIWKRRSKALKSGEIQCNICGDWKRIAKLTDKHFKEEFNCKDCTPETPKPKTIPKKINTKSVLAEECSHKPLFGCKRPIECRGCYYNPNKKIALMTVEIADVKTVGNDWLYGNKKHTKTTLSILEDIKHGRGLHKGGNRSYFKYARKSVGEED